jgi:tetratricopeptide (TPR) repeat protein
VAGERPVPSEFATADVASLLAEAAGCLRAGDNSGAERRSREVLARTPGSVEAWTALGLALHFTGRHGEAETAFTELVRIDPEERAHWVNLGNARRADGRADEALTAFSKAADLGERSADFFYNVGLAHLERRDFASATAVLERALKLVPRDAEIRVAYARACYESLQMEEAARALADWAQFENLGTPAVADIAYLLMNLGESTQATQAMNRALLDPDCPPAAGLTLVKLLERTNQVDEARKLLDRVSSHPQVNDERRDLQLVEAQIAQRLGEHTRAAVMFRQALQQDGPFDARHYQLFPLAKSLDALGRYNDAIVVLREAHASQQAYIEHAAPLVALRGAPTMEITRYGCDPADVAQWSDRDAPAAEESPIFIVGFPRSGTTLLELTLDAHPNLVSMDEQPFLQNALDDMLALGIKYPDRLAVLDDRQLQYLRARYWERAVTKVTVGPDQRLVDKNPLNLLRLPVIRRVFPNAPIILVIRHPCDVLLSCYMQHFRSPDFALLCKDPVTIATGMRRAFEFWYQQCEILTCHVLEIRYESLVSNFESEVRALAAYVGVPWNDAMLAPSRHAQNKGFISTPSYAQVVQPVSAKSIGRWRRYEREFAPVVPILAPLLQRWSYDGAGSPNSR